MCNKKQIRLYQSPDGAKVLQVRYIPMIAGVFVAYQSPDGAKVLQVLGSVKKCLYQ